MKGNFQVAETVYNYVKNYLRNTGTKQGYLATQIGIDPKRFSQLMNARVPIQIEDLIKICAFFNEEASTFIKINPSGLDEAG